MPKTDLKKILKEGATGKFAEVDYSSKDKQKELLDVKKKQDEVMKRESIDLQKLSNYIIKI
jgi:hypothetical protein